MHRYLKNAVFIAVFWTIMMTSVRTTSAEQYKTIAVNDLYAKDYLKQSEPSWDLMKKPVDVKGIYMTGHTVASQKRFASLLGLVDRTELNAVVIDVKNDEGLVMYKSDLKDVQLSGANSSILIKDIRTIVKTLDDKKVYPIARIVTFKDNKAASKFPNLAVKTHNGSVWRDRHGQAWLNPYNPEAWEYVVDVAEEAAINGFKEIQFDYVRFPTDGNMKAINYGSSQNIAKEKAISDFLKYARNRLSKMGVVVSADVFGLVTTVKDDMNIGQQLEYISESVDVICPMVYPSHYGNGSYGVSVPDFEPYKIVNYSMKTAQQRLNDNTGNIAKLRPWLQDFTASYLPSYKVYGPKEIRAQIKATNDAGVKEWILWNAGNKYTAGGLMNQ